MISGLKKKLAMPTSDELMVCSSIPDLISCCSVSFLSVVSYRFFRILCDLPRFEVQSTVLCHSMWQPTWELTVVALGWRGTGFEPGTCVTLLCVTIEPPSLLCSSFLAMYLRYTGLHVEQHILLKFCSRVPLSSSSTKLCWGVLLQCSCGSWEQERRPIKQLPRLLLRER